MRKKARTGGQFQLAFRGRAGCAYEGKTDGRLVDNKLGHVDCRSDSRPWLMVRLLVCWVGAGVVEFDIAFSESPWLAFGFGARAGKRTRG